MLPTLRSCLLFSLACAATLSARADDQVYDRDHWVARQGTATLTLADIDANLADIPEDQRFGYMNSPKRIEDTIRNLLLARQLADVARSRALQDGPEFKQRMKLIEDRMLAAELIDRMKTEVPVGDLEKIAHESYLANPTAYRSADVFDVQQILISGDNRTPGDARSLAIELRDRVIKGEDFAALAAKYSDDKGTNKIGGELKGLTVTNQLEPNFVEEMQRLTKDGQVANLIQTRFGFHVLRLIHREPGRPRPYFEVRKQILDKLSQDRVQAAIKDYTDNMRSVALDADPDVVASLRTRYMTKPAAAAGATEAPSK